MTPITEAKIKWIAYSCQVINCRAEPKNTSFLPAPRFPSWRHSLGMSHHKIPRTPNPTPLHATQKVSILFLGFSLQEKKILGTLSKLVFITLSYCPGFLGSTYFDMNLDCLLFPLLDACSDRGWLCQAHFCYTSMALTTFFPRTQTVRIDEGILHYSHHSKGK